MLPHDDAAERAVLGGLLIENALVDRPEFPRLKLGDFCLTQHQRFFAGFLALHATGRVVDLATLSSLLEERGELDDDGRTYLASLPNVCPSLAAVPAYARRVLDLSRRRAEMRRAARVLYEPRPVNGRKRIAGCAANGDEPHGQAPRVERRWGPNRDERRWAQPPLPLVVSNRPLRDVSRDSLAALVARNDPPQIFLRGGQLVRIRRDERAQPMIEPLSEHALHGQLARAATFLRLGPDGSPVHVPPPLDVTRDLAALGTWPTIPPLAGFVEAPVLRPNGTILSAPGYDDATHLFYAPAPDLVVPPVPEAPSSEDVVRAVRLLDESIGGFPFDGDASRAHAIALLVTLTARPAISGPAPLFLVSKPMSGTGASLLCEVAAHITTGRPGAMMSPPRDDEEARKAITAALLSGAPFNVLDNAERTLAAPSIARMLTATVWRDRLLGRSEQVSLPQRAVWALTGNAVRIAGDLARRSMLIRLDARVPRPWERREFKHPNLVAWVSERRGDLLAAVLTICRAWYAAGQPAADVPPMGGFEAWARIVGGILAHAGIEGFLQDRESLYAQVDEEHFGWPEFLRLVREAFGGEPFSTRDLMRRLDEPGPLHDALPERLSDGALTVRRLGEALKRRVDVRFGNDSLRVERVQRDREGTRWRIVVDDPAPAGEPAADLMPCLEPAQPESAADDAGRRRYVLNLARGRQFPRLPFAPGRAVSAGEPAWVVFATRAPEPDLDPVLAALQALGAETP